MTRTPSPRRTGYTLLELVASMGSATVLMLGLASTIFISTQGMNGNSPAVSEAEASEVLHDVMGDLNHAIRFSTRTANSVTFSVPDRDGDSLPETISYSWSGTAGDPLTYSYNGGPTETIAEDVQNFNLTYLTRFMTGAVLPPPEAGSSLLLVVVDPGSLTAQESSRKTLMETWGYSVNLLNQSDTQGNFDAAIAENDVIYVSEQVTDLTVGAKLKSAMIGVVNEEPEFASDFGFAQDTQSKDRQDIQIVDNSHYITSELTVGMLTIFSSLQPVPLLTGTESPDSAVLGEAFNIGSQYEPSLVTLSAGDALWDAGTADGRRVQLPWGYAGFDINSLNADGQSIMQKAIEWAAGAGDDPLGPGPFGYDTIFATQAGANSQQVATLATLTEDGTLNSITAYVKAFGTTEFRFAIYSDLAGEPGNLIVESGLATGSGTDWLTLTVPPTALTAGNYWLALCCELTNQKYHREDNGGQSRTKSNDAVDAGYLATWGSSGSSDTYKISIYGDYTPSE